MKKINEYIIERLKLSKNDKVQEYKYQPKTSYELYKLIKKLIRKRGLEADLNDIDTSKITNMSSLFWQSDFNGDISKWNVSKVEDMGAMFSWSKFNGDISQWDVSHVQNMGWMFGYSKFNRDISDWDISNVKDMHNIFDDCPLEKNPPKWYKE